MYNYTYPFGQPYQGYNTPNYGYNYQAGAQNVQSQPQQGQQIQQPAGVPVVYTTMFQVEDEAAMDSFPVGIGETVCLITKAEDVICYRKGRPDRSIETIKYYQKKPEQKKPVEYVTKEEFAAAISELKNKANYSQQNSKAGKSGGDK